jgi:hypothetical protein
MSSTAQSTSAAGTNRTGSSDDEFMAAVRTFQESDEFSQSWAAETIVSQLWQRQEISKSQAVSWMTAVRKWREDRIKPREIYNAIDSAVKKLVQSNRWT